eukprot:2575315-Amphidinium_carterae.1
MPPWRRNLLAGKRLLLLKEMMRDAGCHDDGLVEDVVQGITLVGELPKSGEWPTDFRPCTVKLEALDAMCGAIRRR